MESGLTLKPVILHIIDNWGKGGAETVLFNSLNDINERYEIILVTLNDQIEFDLSQLNLKHSYCLGHHKKSDILRSSIRLRKIISLHKPVLIRSQLYWSTIISRIAKPYKIPLVFSIHSLLNQGAFSKSRLSFYLEKLTYKKEHSIIAVSNAALKDYNQHIHIKGRSFVLNNFVSNLFFQQSYNFNLKINERIKLVAVGNLKIAKNYRFLLSAFSLINKKTNISLDIIGDGYLKDQLQKIIDEKKLPINLLGKMDNIHNLLPQYDAFIMCSLYEGLGNAPIEAMAIGLPLILNGTEVMKEMSQGNALFFESGNENALAEILGNLRNKNKTLTKLSEKGKEIAKRNYTKEIYLKKLFSIYEKLLKNNLSE